MRRSIILLALAPLTMGFAPSFAPGRLHMLYQLHVVPCCALCATRFYQMFSSVNPPALHALCSGSRGRFLVPTHVCTCSCASISCWPEALSLRPRSTNVLTRVRLTYSALHGCKNRCGPPPGCCIAGTYLRSPSHTAPCSGAAANGQGHRLSRGPFTGIVSVL